MQKERFLNICKANAVPVWNLICCSDYFIGTMFAADFFRLRSICKKCKVRILIVEKSGIYFWLKKHPSVISLCVTFLIFILSILFLKNHIWKIDIQGNQRYSDSTVIRYLAEEKITAGTSRNRLDCSQIAGNIRKDFSYITWVSVKIDGSCLSVTLKEKPEEDSKGGHRQPCDIRADYNGKIVKAVVRDGILQIPVGESCKAGDRLVSGEIPIVNDSQEIVRYEYVAADADIYIQRTLTYKDSIKREQIHKVCLDNKLQNLYIQFPHQRIWLLPQKKVSANESVVGSYWYLNSDEFYLPNFSIGIQKRRICKQTPFILSEKESTQLLLKRLDAAIWNLKEKKVEILQNDVKIEVDNVHCKAYGSFVIIEAIGVKQRITKTPLETERIILDEQ